MVKRLIVACVPFLFVLLCLLNLANVFMPEIGFDALWYHLTLPKLWLFKHRWYFPGGLLYYSVMPRLAETIFIPLVKYTSYVGPKTIQFLAGLTTCLLIFKLTYRFTKSKKISWAGVSIFYFTWVVSWQSGSAYVDLIRTAIELWSLYLLITSQKKSTTISAGILLGLAVGTKWHSVLSLAILAMIFSPLILLPASLLALPWMFIAYSFTGNPVYPIFSSLFHNAQINNLGPHFYAAKTIIFRLLTLPYQITFPYDDYLSPIFGVALIFCLFNLLSRNAQIRKLSLYSILGIAISLLVPPPSPRYYLPYLPGVAISAAIFIHHLKPHIQTSILAFFVLSHLFILGLRIYSFSKYIPLIARRQSVNQFLTLHANRLPGTFIDSDNYVKDHLTGKKIVIDKLHNLYYFPYDYDHSSWMDDISHYDYLVTTDSKPSSISGTLEHTNPIGIQIYKLK